MKKLLMIVSLMSLFLSGCDAETEQALLETDVDAQEVVVEDIEELTAEQIQKEEERKAELVQEQEKLLAAQAELRAERKAERELAEANPNKTGETEAPTKPVEVPEGEEVLVINDNIPFFSNEDITSVDVYHRNGSLDSMGRVTAANALLGVEIMPAEQRGNISGHEPTGWNQASYANIDSGGWLYNRSHLIGHQLTGNDDYANLMTGTRAFNVRMLEYENFVANYIETTENHVRYRVTPVFKGDNLVATGAYMEGFSIEDNGEGIMFNIYVPNVQEGVTINYVDGSSIGPAGPAEDGEIAQYNPSGDSDSGSSESSGETTAETPPPAPTPAVQPGQYVDENGNGLIKGSNSGIYHVPGSTYYKRTTNPATWFKSIEEAEAAGYRAPKR